MAFGSQPYGSTPLGGGFAELDLSIEPEQELAGQHILLVSALVDQALIAYFVAHPEQMKTMDRRQFEELVAEIFRGFGYTVELTQRTRDGGKDIVALRHGVVKEKLLVECKRPDPGTKINVQTIRALLGVKDIEGGTKALLVTTAYFSPEAKEVLEKKQWELEGKDYDDLLIWTREYIGLKKQQ